MPVQKDTKRYATTKKIVDCMTSTDGMVQTATTFAYYIPPTADGQQALLAKDSSLQPWVDAVKAAKGRTSDNLGTKYPKISEQLWTAVQNALSGSATPADALKAAGYPSKADPAKMNKIKIVAILSILVIFVTMVYGPIAATLVELFPTRIRYSSMSLAYHIGNGWFGGLMPTIAFAMVAQNGDIYYGLWYPISIAAITFVIGMAFVRETKDVDIYAKFLYWHPNKL